MSARHSINIVEPLADAGEDLDKLEIVDSQDGRFSLRQRLTIPAGGYLKVVRKNG